jgi:glutamate racemase
MVSATGREDQTGSVTCVEGATIGVFDSGVGGLTVAGAIHRAVPSVRILYFGDTARCPYGDRSPGEVRMFAREIAAFLCAQGIDLLVVACNTATAVALPLLQSQCPVPVLGVVEPGARAAARAGARKIGVIGTVVTITSGAYEQALLQLAPDVEVWSRACPAFVPLVEAGKFDGPEVEAAVRESLAPLCAAEIDALILGCTHYPLLQPVIERVLGPSVRVISSAEETAREVRQRLREIKKQAAGDGHEGNRLPHVFYTSGEVLQMRRAVEAWVGLCDDEFRVESVHLPVAVTSR